jgi:Tfp pilus assembly protein PilV
METTIAMILMMIVGLGGASLFAYAIKYNSGADDRALALALAQQRLEEFRALPFNDASLDVTAATTENTTHGGRPFRIKKTITADATGTIKTITLEVTPMSTTVGNTNSTWSRAAVRVMTQRATTAVGPYL